MREDSNPMKRVQVANQAQLRLSAMNAAIGLTLLGELAAAQANQNEDGSPAAHARVLRGLEVATQGTLDSLWAQMGLLDTEGPAPSLKMHPYKPIEDPQ